MLTLRCAIVGERSVVTTEVESDLLVSDFKEVIIAKRALDIAPVMIVLYVARDDTQPPWLKTTHEDYEALATGDAQTTAGYLSDERRMGTAYELADYFPEQPNEQVQTLHVLVDLPTDEELERFHRLWELPPIQKKQAKVPAKPQADAEATKDEVAVKKALKT